MNTALSAAWTERQLRPQLRRGRCMLLHTGWTLNGKPIRVPYAPESSLSGWQGAKMPLPQKLNTLHYALRFTLPAEFAHAGERILLHFGAVDAVAELTLNGQRLCRHEGGYLPFEADITKAYRPGEENLLALAVTDTLSHRYPYGKQCRKPGGMWYTPVSGIWQPVWAEAVPGENAIRGLKITPGLTGIRLCIDTDAEEVEAEIPLGDGKTLRRILKSGETKGGGADKSCVEGGSKSGDGPHPGARQGSRLEACIDLSAEAVPHLWTPDEPYLYPLVLSTKTDRVESYFALRTVEIKATGGHARICLNSAPVFLHGVLDQGYFDGGYLPADPAEYERDVRRMKQLGFNLLRKHIKIEPGAFYEACDRCGMLVLQDMVNSGGYNWLLDTALPNLGLQHRPDRLPGGAARKAFFKQHCADTQALLYNHPCVVGYTIFNEGWGQFDADENYRLCRARDASRFYDATSGWFAQKESDVDSRHIYFRNTVLRGGARPLLLSECGGYARPVPGHLLHPDAKFGYGTEKSMPALTARILAMYKEMVLPSIPQGLCGCVYTQLADVEEEVNGLFTYDRALCKADPEAMCALAERLARAMAESCAEKLAQRG